MTKIKLCGLSRKCDIETANELLPEYVGFVLWPKSKRYVTSAKLAELKSLLCREIKAVGVFVDEKPELVAELLNHNLIDLAQLHGREDEEYLARLRALTDKPVIKAFCIKSAADISRAETSTADYILLDSGMGTGRTFAWRLLQNITRPYFLAGGLGVANIAEAIAVLQPYGVDVSSGIESDGVKDKTKMEAFVAQVREGEKQ